jgi:hypothetical protein
MGLLVIRGINMPYIKPEDRKKFEFLLDAATQIDNCGDLNYVVSKICLQYLRKKGKKYQNINDIMGALTCVQHELYRKCFGIYEDEKEKENGTIF